MQSVVAVTVPLLKAVATVPHCTKLRSCLAVMAVAVTTPLLKAVVAVPPCVKANQESFTPPPPEGEKAERSVPPHTGIVGCPSKEAKGSTVERERHRGMLTLQLVHQ